MRIALVRQSIITVCTVLAAVFMAPAVRADEIDFARDVLPILKQHCLKCHGPEKQESGFRVDRRVTLLEGGDYGEPAIVPGDPTGGLLLDAVSGKDPDFVMPPDGERLGKEQVALLTRWIQQGAVWPGQMEDQLEHTRSDHWSFQPVERPAVPNLKGDSDAPIRNEIDAFLLVRLLEEGLAFSTQADARTLIRRASIVLTGLPPTPKQASEFQEAWKQDPDAAYSGLIDRLLDSPHFGERWAQHWLDVIRWAESNGTESNLYRKNAWVYRDYLITAFNDDKPYDQFVHEQIAGDQLGAPDATGFLVAGPHVPPQTVGAQPDQIRLARADRLDEMLQTVGASVLGVTIGCARCHNHKFDPIPIRDYYSMVAALQDVDFGARRPEFGPEHEAAREAAETWNLIRRHRQMLDGTGPWIEDWGGYVIAQFPAVEANGIRLTFFDQWIELDEVEVFGPDDPQRNLAHRREAVAVTGETGAEKDVSRLSYVNDGDFGTNTWASNYGKKEKNPEARLTFRFDENRKLNRIRISSNRAYFFETDYHINFIQPQHFSKYKVEILNEEGEWTEIFDAGALQRQDENQPLRATALNEIKRLAASLHEGGTRPRYIGRFIEPVTTHVFRRGDPENPGDEVAPGGLSQLDGDLGLTSESAGAERRLALADWLTRKSHPLTARVMVNRIWHHVFGQGIVATTSDFGKAGAEPSHPELLDWLAAEFVQPTQATAQSWSVKRLIRQMVMSHAFRQSNQPCEKSLAVDADAALLWRFPPKRVEAEVLRDSMLQASGCLNRELGGRSYRIYNVKPIYKQWEVVDNHGPGTWRRMIYQERMRRIDDQLFSAFDLPDCGQIRALRPISTTPLQALGLLNSTFAVDQSQRLAERVETEVGTDNISAQVERAFQLTLVRSPTAQELDVCVQAVRRDGLPTVCRSLFNTNEFAFLP